ncbi:MAG: 6-bladed beta-propeller [Ignavibacteriae bacterium]|nr:6-bladed beta-propeller [Ignavibacteriota bacterium]
MKLIIKILSYICFLIFTLSNVIPLTSQSNKENNSFESKSDITPFDIKYIDKISNDKDIILKKSFIDKVIDFVAGEDIKSLIKPVNLIALDTDNIIVVDQGVQNPVLIDKENGVFKIIRNHNIIYPSLVGICSGKHGKIYFTDSKNNKIYVVNKIGDNPVELNDSLELKQPTGIAYSVSNDELWISETGNHRLLVLDSDGKLKKIIGQRGVAPGEFNFPTYIWIDSDSSVYIVDALNFRIQILSFGGEVISIFGEEGNATGYIASPKGIATDSYGHIFLVDGIFNTIQVFDRKGNFLYYFGSQGKGDGQFWLPSGIYIDKYDRIYVADSYNSRIQIFQLLKSE